MTKLDYSRVEKVLVNWLQEKIRGAGARGAIFGLSGGIDASVVAVLCQKAFGDDALGVIMPCYSNQEDEEDAILLAETFGLRYIKRDLGAGELVVDLADLEEDANVQAAVTFGNLHVLVPDDVEVTVHSRVAAGEVVGRLDDGWSGPGTGRASGRADQTLSNGTGINITLTQDGAATGPQIVVDAEVTFGQIIIEETS